MRLIHTLCVVIACSAAGIFPTTARAGTCTIDAGNDQQTIDGFGFSSAWCGTLSSAKNSALYNTLGMSLLRVKINNDNTWSDETANASAAHSAGAKVLGCPWYFPSAYMSGTTLATSHYGDYCTWLGSACSSIGLDYVSLKNEPDGSLPWHSDREPGSRFVGQWHFCRSIHRYGRFHWVQQ